MKDNGLRLILTNAHHLSNMTLEPVSYNLFEDRCATKFVTWTIFSTIHLAICQCNRDCHRFRDIYISIFLPMTIYNKVADCNIHSGTIRWQM